MDAHVVIVHGSWIDASFYTVLQRALTQRNYSSSCITLPSARSDGLLRTFADDVRALRQDVQQAIEKHGRNVVVLMHSFGGIVGAEALRDLERDVTATSLGGIVALVFVCAFLPGENQSLGDIFGGTLPPWVSQGFDSETKTATVYCDEETALQVFFNDLPVADGALLAKNLRAIPISVPLTKISGEPAYARWHMPMAYVLCEKDQSVPAQYQEMMISNFEIGREVKIERIFLQTGHFPFLTLPQKVVDVVESVLKRV